jgi:hypothetical protein
MWRIRIAFHSKPTVGLGVAWRPAHDLAALLAVDGRDARATFQTAQKLICIRSYLLDGSSVSSVCFASGASASNSACHSDASSLRPIVV